jgi:hypothetical protein
MFQGILCLVYEVLFYSVCIAFISDMEIFHSAR